MSETKKTQPSSDAGSSGTVGPTLPSSFDAMPPRMDFPDLTVEVDDHNCDNWVFPPSSERLRGRWDGHNLSAGSQSSAGLLTMPVLPGIHLTLSLRDRTGIRLDPLSLEQNRDLLRNARAIHKSIWSIEFEPVIFADFRDMNDDALATWLFWIARGISSGNVVRKSGRAPLSEREIMQLLPDAKIKKVFFDSSMPGEQRAEDIPFPQGVNVPETVS